MIPRFQQERSNAADSCRACRFFVEVASTVSDSVLRRMADGLAVQRPLGLCANMTGLVRWTGFTPGGSTRMSLPASRRSAVSSSPWAALAAAFVMLFALSSCGYNTIPTLEEQAKAKWAQVQNNYQRRADLIPNLVATVQGYAKQEKDVLTAVVQARANATRVQIDASQLTDPEKLKQFQEAQSQLSGALGRLLAVSENYPEHKSNQKSLALQ
jgi:hypothetical protein